MGLLKAFSGALRGTLADQWKEVIRPDTIDEHSLLVPGILIVKNSGRGANTKGSADTITNGSKIYVPENTAAFILKNGGIEEILLDAGGYVYQGGSSSIFNGEGISKSIFKQTGERVGFGGITPDEAKVFYVNLREIRDILFGTNGPQLYYDAFYKVDLELRAFGRYSIKVISPIRFIQDFVPSGVDLYSFSDKNVRAQINAELMHSLIAAISSLSGEYRISQLASANNTLSDRLKSDANNAGSWPSRFGFELVNVVIENIELTDQSRELVRNYTEAKMESKANDNETREMSYDKRIETVKKLKDLFDSGILTSDEFKQKKKDILDL